MTTEQDLALVRLACRPNTDAVDAASKRWLERAGLIREVKGFGWYLTNEGVEALSNEDGNGGSDDDRRRT